MKRVEIWVDEQLTIIEFETEGDYERWWEATCDSVANGEGKFYFDGDGPEGE